MIEIEKKFQLTKEQEARLLKNAVFLEKKINLDIFYDYPNYKLSLDDTWLRQRNGRWELKKRLHELGRQDSGTIYDEIEDETSIRKVLKLDNNGSMEEVIKKAGLKPFARIEKHRRSYQHGEFRIDLDVCDFGYKLGEIELLIDNETKTQEALDKISSFARNIGLEQTKPRAKLIEYLYRFSPDHYQTLVNGGVL